MREIKFRAWDKGANIMVYSDHRTRELYDVYYGFEMNENGLLECCWEGDFTESHVLDGGKLDNIMQFTGLDDKNGVEIYEGDIIEAGFLVDGLLLTDSGVVVFKEYRFIVEQPDYGDEDLADWTLGESLEVIGNIYENAELLKEDN